MAQYRCETCANTVAADSVPETCEICGNSNTEWTNLDTGKKEKVEKRRSLNPFKSISTIKKVVKPLFKKIAKAKTFTVSKFKGSPPVIHSISKTAPTVAPKTTIKYTAPSGIVTTPFIPRPASPPAPAKAHLSDREIIINACKYLLFIAVNFVLFFFSKEIYFYKNPVFPAIAGYALVLNLLFYYDEKDHSGKHFIVFLTMITIIGFSIVNFGNVTLFAMSVSIALYYIADSPYKTIFESIKKYILSFAGIFLIYCLTTGINDGAIYLFDKFKENKSKKETSKDVKDISSAEIENLISVWKNYIHTKDYSGLRELYMENDYQYYYNNSEAQNLDQKINLLKKQIGKSAIQEITTENTEISYDISTPRDQKVTFKLRIIMKDKTIQATVTLRVYKTEETNSRWYIYREMYEE